MGVGAGTRIVVIGTSGAGKTTLARKIAGRLGLPHIELDAINWQPGWRDLDRHDRPEFVRRVAQAIQAERWVADGNYASVRDVLWRRRDPSGLARLRTPGDHGPGDRALACTARRWGAKYGSAQAIASTGMISCGRAIPSAGPGAPGASAGARPRTDCGGRSSRIWRCFDCGARRRRRAC